MDNVPLLLLCLVTLLSLGSRSPSLGVEAKKEIGVYEIKKGNFSVKITNWGATVISVILPNKCGKLDDVVLGYDSIKDYQNDTTYFGAIVGRVANRISGAQFSLNCKHYNLIPNEGHNMLHGGPKGFSRVIWKVDKHQTRGHSPYITFSYDSFDGEEGFPGNLKVKVTYKIVHGHKLLVIMTAKALNKATPVNLAQHTYWNLNGHDSGSILSHLVKIYGSKITPVDKYLIPTGKFKSVKGTPYDFRKPRTVGSRIRKLPHGYDINYVLDGRHYLKRAATVLSKESGRKMELWTNEPGVQFYTGNMLVKEKGKGGYVYGPHAGLCLETQGFPDAVNHHNFPSQILNPGHTYKHCMLYVFSTIS